MVNFGYRKYPKEFRLEAVRLVTEGRGSPREVARYMSLPESTLGNWLRAFKAGKLERIGETHRVLTDVKMELARVKRELVLVRIEREILIKAAAYFAKESLHARGDGADATGVFDLSKQQRIRKPTLTVCDDLIKEKIKICTINGK
jgi:transposase